MKTMDKIKIYCIISNTLLIATAGHFVLSDDRSEYSFEIYGLAAVMYLSAMMMTDHE